MFYDYEMTSFVITQVFSQLENSKYKLNVSLSLSKPVY